MSIPRLTPSDYTLERLTDVILASGDINERQKSEVLRQAKATRERLEQSVSVSNPLGRGNIEVTPAEVIAAMRLTAVSGRSLDEDRVMVSVASLARMSGKKIDPLRLDHDLITKTMTRPFARRHVCLPLSKDDHGVITFAVDNPFDQDLMHTLSALVSGRVRFVVSAKRDILRIITEIYGFRRSVLAAERDMSTGVELGNLEQLVRLKKHDELEANDQHVVNAVEYLLHYAYNQRASDIHIEPLREDARVRLRIDGVLHQLFRLPKVVQKAMVSRLKTLSRLDIAERRRPQDGRIKTLIGEVETELRVSTMPVAFGEKLVIRIFDPGQLFCNLTELGMANDQLDHFHRFLSERHGIVLVTGPTGSGKTTTLYSTLHHLAGPEINIVTIEDPIEMVHDAFNQVQVMRRIDLTFAAALRSVLRQDPDIIMVGEIRDAETAQMAIQAALTGHLVFSTIHTNDTATAITRLRDLNVPPFLIASTLTGVIAQRLLRLNCEVCAVPDELTPSQAAALSIEIPPGSTARLPIKVGEGCPRCRETGLYGRKGVFEVLPITESIRNLMRTDADARTISKTARADGMRSLRESAIHQLAAGQTCFSEVVRVVGQEA